MVRSGHGVLAETSIWGWIGFYLGASVVLFLFPVIGFSVLAAGVIVIGSLWLTSTYVVAGVIAIVIIFGAIFYQLSFLLPGV